ncbi:hypothetical protein Q8F55_006308 [Vanrija albida]|uniref:HTH APSES-type domain-containing protein n=1 Tax=Vanrija albida TaxID=181172 RepID=A0ABR3PWS1_9TREE
MPANPAAARLNEADLEAFTTTAPPPPYSESATDFPTTPQHVNRPRLPEAKRNPNLRNLPEDATLVKFQTIVREGQEIVVGRIKVPTPGPNQHAFILRRYDTQAISLTTMFKVSFPGATEDEEKKEMEWVRSSYDTRNTNGGRDCDAVRLAGQWVSRHLAIHLAPAYGISNLVTALSRAVPDPSVSYRKSQRSQAAADELAKQKATTMGQTPPAATPARAAPSLAAPTDAASRTPKRARKTTSEAAATPEASGSRVFTVEATTTVTAPAGTAVDMNAEIESAKQLVRDLKQQLRERAAAGEDLEDQGFAQPESSRGAKRSAGETDEGVSIASGAKGDRAIRTNKRVEQGGAVQTAKRVALGSILLGVGASAGYFLPHILPQIGQFASQFF